MVKEEDPQRRMNHRINLRVKLGGALKNKKKNYENKSA